MNLLAEHARKQSELERLKEDLKKIEQSDEYKELTKFQGSLEKLMDQYGKSARDVVKLLQPDASAYEKPARRERPLMTYTNPHTNEVVKVRGGNNRILNEWRRQHGKETVNSWKS